MAISAVPALDDLLQGIEDVPEQDASIVGQNADGTVVVSIGIDRPKADDNKWDANLALSTGELSGLAERLMEGIEADITSRAEWENARVQGISLLGLKLEEPRSDAGSSSIGVEGMSSVRHPGLLEAILRGWANAVGELLPAEGPAKIKNTGRETAKTDKSAEDFEKDFNAYLTNPKVGYYPDTSRAIFWSRFGGSHFKKVYHDPIRRMPVSEAVDANDIIVSNAAATFESCGRVTHRVTMRPSTLKRMVMLGLYRDVPLVEPTQDRNRVDQKLDTIEGVQPSQERAEDQPYTLYECYTECELDFDGKVPAKFRDAKIPVPYRVTVEKDSRQVLEIRRNWREDDEKCLARKTFVKYPYVDAMGFYGIGLLQILGNATRALTAAWREALDAGMFASFPGGFVLKSAVRQNSNEQPVSPGQFRPLDTTVSDIRNAILPNPFHDVTPGLMALIDKIEAAMQRVGGTADIPVGEGRQDAPVGTTLALIEQATKVEAAVHKGLHGAQSEEFQLLKDLFKEDPEAFWMHNPACAAQWDQDTLLRALDDCHLVPVADPNVPSHMHRLMKTMGLIQLQSNPAFGQIMNTEEILRRALAALKEDDIDALILPPQPAGAPQPDPNVALMAGAKMAQVSATREKTAMQAQGDAAELASKEKVAALNLARELVIHAADRQNAAASKAADQAHDIGMQQMTQGHDLTMQAIQPPGPGGEGQ